MASGNFHANVAKVAAPSVMIGLILHHSPAEAAIAYGLLVGILITPDLDHSAITFEEKRFLKLNRRFGKLWLKLSNLYSKRFIHRGQSHWIIFGTITRLPYGLLLSLPAIFLFNKFGIPPFETLFFIFCGWTFQDTIHIITDWIYSWLKKRRKKKRKKKVKH